MSFVTSQLFLDVQLAAIFSDSKTFADAIANDSWQTASQLYLQVKPLTKQQLAEFVAQHFTLESTELPTTQLNVSDAQSYIASLWPYLKRNADIAKSSSLMPLKHDYIVPGGRFQEIYYWDSYFTALGLQDIGDIDSIDAMLANFIDLQNRNGCIPNGNRSYYSSRSQPPILALMVDLLWQAKYHDEHDLNWLTNCIAALQHEYEFWMQGSELLSAQMPAHRRVVKMPCGALLNRYWDDEATPRQESLREDLHDAALLPEQQRASYYRNIRAACESGWDFSSRWLANSNELTSIQTTDIIPIDLNSLLYHLEKQLSVYYQIIKESTKQAYFELQATRRKAAINKYLFSTEQAFFVDYNFKQSAQSSVLSLAGVVPLFINCANKQQAMQVSTKVMQNFLKPGGLVTTLNETSQQWDSPNGWAPLQWFAVQGLRQYGFAADANIIISHWLKMIEIRFKVDGCLLEKYNVCELANQAGGGEYKVQQGFGWTNGITSRFYNLVK
ncbi:trehalase family glycosidase [Pseudoalteromonas sp.]|uniref:trehalase family glycosidase n=1 Tax=Pseudoalteromonas sp. TaxID=53249 RepID=UPI0030036BE5